MSGRQFCLRFQLFLLCVIYRFNVAFYFIPGNRPVFEMYFGIKSRSNNFVVEANGE